MREIYQKMLPSLVIAFVMLVLVSSPVWAGSNDSIWSGIYDRYLFIGDQLASDSIVGVRDGANQIAKDVEKLDRSPFEAVSNKQVTEIPSRVKAAASAVSSSEDIEQMRNAYVELSRPLVLFASVEKRSDLTVVYCSMKPGSWLQKGTEIRNPYYGSKMLRCGEIIPPSPPTSR